MVNSPVFLRIIFLCVLYAGCAHATSADMMLEALIQGDKVLYPGQHTVLVYKIYTKKEIELTSQQLPLLDALGLQLSGEPKMKEGKYNSYWLQEVFQEVTAVNPGDYLFGPSYLEGYAYTGDAVGRKLYGNTLLRAEAPAVTLRVLPFPAQNKPATFDGAVGNFILDVALKEKPFAAVGDQIILEAAISGEGEFDTVRLPLMSQQTAFSSGQFRFGDLPPVGVMRGNVKTFQIALWPLSEKITEIPALEFSFFDPQAQRYRIVSSTPIPLTVYPLVPRDAHLKDKALKLDAPLEPQSPLSKGSLIFIGIGVILCTAAIGIVMKRIRHLRKRSSRCHLRAAKNALADPSLFWRASEQAIFHALKEKGAINKIPHSYGELPVQGICAKVHHFFSSIEAARYGKGEEFSCKEAWKQVKALYKEVQSYNLS